MNKVQTSISGVRKYPTSSKSEADARIHLRSAGSNTLNSADIEITVESPDYVNIELGSSIPRKDNVWEPAFTEDVRSHFVIPVFVTLDTEYREFDGDIRIEVRSGYDIILSTDIKLYR